jgi:uncharacterized SAM-binding protein YcdF (DUF218 family)
MFWLKKDIGFWLMPLPFCMVLLFLGLLLARSRRRQRLGLGLAFLAAAVLLLLSNTFISVHLLQPLEAFYPAVPELSAGSPPPKAIAGCRFVAVLGSGSSDIPGIPAASLLSTSGLGRIVEAVRILRLLPDARLIVSGPGAPGKRTHAATLAAAAISLGVSPDRITLVETARDTEDEGQAVAHIVGGQQTALVTSAWHMPRAARLFAKAGVNFVACPCDYVSRSEDQFGWGVFKCDSESLERSTLAVHEAIGLLWLRLRGI